MREQHSNAPRRLPHRRGAVMIEFALVLPFLALIIGLTFFFGWSMVNQQHVRSAHRYLVWRDFYGWDDPNRPNANPLTREETLNRDFFAGGANPLSLHGSHSVTPDAIEGLLNAAGSGSSDAYDLAVDSVQNRFPHGLRASVHADFPTTVALWQRFTGTIEGRHDREGRCWRRHEVNYLEALRDLFLTDFDNAVGRLQDAQLQDDLRSLYLWPYHAMNIETRLEN